MIDEPTPPPQKLPPWVKKEILLPIIGVFLIGGIFGNYLVYRAIKKDGRFNATKYGPMDRRPMPGNNPLSQAVVDTGREFRETNGIVRFAAAHFSRMTGAWKTTKDNDRNVMRMSGPDGQMFEGRHMYLAYRIHFTTPGRYRLWGLMRSSGTTTTDDVWIYWNREPRGERREDFELKVGTTNYVWSATFKDRPPPEADSERPKNRAFAALGFPVEKPGTYTLYIAKGEEPFHPDQTVGTDADFFAFDQFVLKHFDLADTPD